MLACELTGILVPFKVSHMNSTSNRKKIDMLQALLLINLLLHDVKLLYRMSINLFVMEECITLIIGFGGIGKMEMAAIPHSAIYA